MNEEDRKKVFWLLKKYSSYTAWAALGEAYADFVKAWEYAMEHADYTTHTDWYKEILDGQIAFEKGLPLLREGQRSVFRNTSTGYLNRAADKIVFIARIMDPDEFDFDWMKNKDDVVAAAQALDKATSGLLMICEADKPPFIVYGPSLIFRPLNGPFNFPAKLPELPAATDTRIQSGDPIPLTGIWESQWNNGTGLLERGGLGYLLAGAVAPLYKEDYYTAELGATWRLIWADHRYEDGTIPEEEKDYLAEVPEPGQERLRGLPSEAVPKTGWWHTPALGGETGLRYFKQGERFPEAETSAYGQVIWNYDPANQDPSQA